ncbi:MAG TPA: hypothetical protein VN040_18100 [Pseudosphingobacterium sp.]|nr:hypothetical protein [Pseudosphingobacterium sp.]
MQGRFHQYMFGVLCTILISFGWYYATPQHYSSSIKYHSVEHADRPVNSESLETKVARKGKHHRREKIRAYFPESENENDNTENDPNPSPLILFIENDFRKLISYFSTDFLNRRVAILLANSENLTSSKNALYIHYRVFRL